MKNSYNKSKFTQQYLSLLSAEDRELIGWFVDEFKDTHTYKDFELRVSSKEVKEFLSRHQSSLSFTRFNRMTGCSGISSGNLYVYELVILLSLKESVKENVHRKSFTLDRIYTINGYGSKRFLSDEWKALLSYVSEDLGSNETLVDTFAGTGYISLEAAKQKLFNHIIQNDASTELYNYYCVMKDEVKYQEFRHILEILPQPTEEALELVRSKFYIKTDSEEDVKTFAGLEKRRQLQTVDAKRAAYLFYLKHFMVRSVGNLEKSRKATKYYLSALDKTHELYKDIEVKNLLYYNAIRDFLMDEKCLIVLDAPYMQDQRTQKKSYSIEFNTFEEHQAMLNKVREACAKVIICGYQNTSYDAALTPAFQEWHCLKVLRTSRASSKHEYLWMNFNIDELVERTGYFEKIY